MIKPFAAWSKARKGMALNLSELAVVSGYDRGVLSSMNLPLQAKKISWQDFQRIMRKRQDWHERSNRPKAKPHGQAAPSAPANGDQKREAADTFYGRSSKRAGKAASRPAQQFQLQGTA